MATLGEVDQFSHQPLAGSIGTSHQRKPKPLTITNHPRLRKEPDSDERRPGIRGRLQKAAKHQVAKLYFHYSAMNAGKTTALLQGAWNYRERGMRTLILAPVLDHRAGENAVASRIGLRAPARRFAPGDELLGMVRDDVDQDGALHCVFVDEAQFLTKAQVWQLTDVVDVLHIPVMAYGLRTDFRGELFIGSSYLLAWADELHEIKTICQSGRKATMVLRVDARGVPLSEGPQVEIGGNERYVSVSRAEFKRIKQSASIASLPQSCSPPDDDSH